MTKIKNVRPGILVIPDAGLKLRPGQVAEVAALSEQTARLIASGHLARVGEAPATEPANPSSEPTNPPTQDGAANASADLAQDLSKLSAQQAIAQVAEMNDPARIRECIGTEKRRSVLDMLDKKLKEVAGGAE